MRTFKQMSGKRRSAQISDIRKIPTRVKITVGERRGAPIGFGQERCATRRRADWETGRRPLGRLKMELTPNRS